MDVIERAQHIHEHASSLGFDWDDVSGVLDKVREETDEIAEALRSEDDQATRCEFGDLYFTLVNLARFLGADPQTELSRACDRFESRFQDLQSELKQRGVSISDCTLAELDSIWSDVKRQQAECRHNA